ncbi:hypothetical protein Bca52824_053495 [Brassica carinata]|uniref:26S proteasome complex subunit SEM1 n=1 Tax=Brassica carinata TaxID=52824 RepID=A0A8X7R5E4_BRACI|nr:hypothetical protein Bca52824_053495 [Brassica carinata]
MATVTFELLRDFCNGLRYGFIVLNPINSNVHVVFFNVLLASAKRRYRRDLTTNRAILKVGGGGDESTTPISSVTKEFSPWLETVVTYEVRAPEAGWISLSTRDRCLRPAPAQVRNSRRGPRSRSSQYMGISYLRLLEKKVLLGGFDTAHAPARAFDPAAIKFRGVDSDINFTVDWVENEEQVKEVGLQWEDDWDDDDVSDDFSHQLRKELETISADKK